MYLEVLRVSHNEFTKFRESGRQISSAELVDAVEAKINLLHSAWETSLSEDSDGRDRCYLQIQGIKTVMIELITENWS